MDMEETGEESKIEELQAQTKSVEETASVLDEFLNETESNYNLNEGENEEEDKLLKDYQEEMIFEETGEEEELKLNYIDMQVEIILSDLGKKLLCDEYKKYIDEAVFVCLQSAIMCR